MKRGLAFGCIWVMVLLANSVQALQTIYHYSVFYEWKNDRWQPYADIYWQADARQLDYTAYQQDSFKVKLVALLSQQSIAHEIRTFSDTLILRPAAEQKEAMQQIIAGQFRIPLDSGRNNFEISLKQTQGNQSGYTASFFIDQQSPVSPVFLSSIQLIDTIVKIPYSGSFEKNNFYHFPRPHNYFDSTLLEVNLYSEWYARNPAAKKVFLHTYVSKSPFGTALKSTLIKDTATLWRQAYELTRVPLYYLSSGNYYFNQELRDSAGNLWDKKFLFFQLNNPHPMRMPQDTTLPVPAIDLLPKYVDLATTFVKKYDLAQMKAILKMLRIIADEPEQAAINSLGLRPDDLAIRNFIYNFWLKRDAVAPEKAWNAYADQIRMINREYGSVGMPGYESDQGIIYVRYGKPNDIIRVNNETGAYPYEIWQYYAVGTIGREGLFLFYQPGNSLGSMTLLHSTVRGERQNREWRSKLYPGGQPSNDFSSRAIQYFGNK